MARVRPTRRDRGVPRAHVERFAAGRHPLRRYQMEAENLALAGELQQHANTPRPRTWGECRESIGAWCPWVACRHHLAIDINPETGSLKLNFPTLELWEMPATCSLFVAEGGRRELERVGELMNLVRERIRQIEVRALHKLKAALTDKEAA